MSLPLEKGVIPSVMGGLGNQLWIVVSSYVSSRIHGCPHYIPKNTIENNAHNTLKHDYTESIFKYLGTMLPEYTDSIISQAIQQGYKVQAPDGFSPWDIQTHGPGTIFRSYYQFYHPSIVYFESEIRSLLCKGLESYCQNIKDKYNVSDAAFLHIRRGDYLKHPDLHYIQSIEYYKKAVNELLASKSPPKKIYVFSDDSTWVLQQTYFKTLPCFEIVESNNELETLAHMSLCTSGAICGNSTFSWWGAFLGSYGTRSPIYVPKRWINLKIHCLFPPEWIVLE
jgi:Glycosyl transferase family 11